VPLESVRPQSSPRPTLPILCQHATWVKGISDGSIRGTAQLWPGKGATADGQQGSASGWDVADVDCRRHGDVDAVQVRQGRRLRVSEADGGKSQHADRGSLHPVALWGPACLDSRDFRAKWWDRTSKSESIPTKDRNALYVTRRSTPSTQPNSPA
jgi:hypothetical protein